VTPSPVPPRRLVVLAGTMWATADQCAGCQHGSRLWATPRPRRVSLARRGMPPRVRVSSASEDRRRRVGVSSSSSNPATGHHLWHTRRKILLAAMGGACASRDFTVHGGFVLGRRRWKRRRESHTRIGDPPRIRMPVGSQLCCASTGKEPSFVFFISSWCCASSNLGWTPWCWICVRRCGGDNNVSGVVVWVCTPLSVRSI
jgi:hypothetical protein